MRGVILAGGQSARLGRQSKAQIELGGCRLIDRVLRSLEPVCENILVVVKEPSTVIPLPSSIRVVLDSRPDRGALIGLLTGLVACEGEPALVTGCDLPFLNPRLLDAIGKGLGSANACVPRIEGRLQPLLAAYSTQKPVLDVLSERMKLGLMSLTGFVEAIEPNELSEADLSPIDPNLESFFNLNTPQDLTKAKELAEGCPPS